MTTFKELQAATEKQLQEDLHLYREAVKYAKHSKRKAKAEKNLAEVLRTHQLRGDMRTLSLEELEKKYPELYEGVPIEERVTYLG